MVVIQISGGLGNQLFQYAFAFHFIMNKREVKIKTAHKNDYVEHNGFELYRIFGHCITTPQATLRDLFYFVEKIKLNQNIEYQLRDGKKLISEPLEFSFTPDLLEMDDVFFQGYWQHINYFEKYSEALKAVFTFPEIPRSDVKNFFYKEQIEQQECSVSIHIRRGDYLKYPFYIILDESYYLSAIELIKSRYKKAVFYVFSDDIPYARNLIDEPDTVFISHNKKENSFRDMQLMALCDHNIIANSTFSWWGAYLNKNSNKTVIVPQKWFTEEVEISGLIDITNWIKL